MNFTLNTSPFQLYTPIEIPLNIGLAFILGILIAIIYRFTSRNNAVSQSFMLTLVMLSMIVALVMMVIGNSLIRAFSLVGALSIIRFRTVVKENRDIAFIFLSLGAGMAAGVGNHQLAIYGVATLLGLLLVLDFIQFGSTSKGVYLLRFQLPASIDNTSFERLFDKYLVSFGKLAIKTVRMGEFVEHSYMIRLKSNVRDQALLSELMAISGIEKVTMVPDETESEL